jgi:hypothetical protein
MIRCKRCGYGIDSPCECEDDGIRLDDYYPLDDHPRTNEEREWAGVEIKDSRW